MTEPIRFCLGLRFGTSIVFQADKKLVVSGGRCGPGRGNSEKSLADSENNVSEVRTRGLKLTPEVNTGTWDRQDWPLEAVVPKFW